MRNGPPAALPAARHRQQGQHQQRQGRALGPKQPETRDIHDAYLFAISPAAPAIDCGDKIVPLAMQ
jgi:hypothetical protein